MSRATPNELTWRTCVCLVLVLLASAVGGAEASRKPTDSERSKIEAQLDTVGFNCAIYPEGDCKRTIRISTENERWAAGYIKGTPGHQDTVQSAAASLIRKNHRWRIHQAGNGGGCDVPSAVVRDLRLECF